MLRLLGLVFCHPLAAHNYNSECLKIGAEWLYFMPSFDQSEYAVKGEPGFVLTSLADYHQIDQGFRTGYRIGIEYLPDSCLPDTTIRYTRFNQKLESNVTSASNNLFPALGVATIASALENASGFIEGEQRFDYYAIEGLIFPCSLFCCHASLKFLTGLKYANIHYTDQMLLNASDSRNGPGVYTVTNRLRSQGIGPQIGLQGTYSFWSCFSLIGQLQIAGLVSSAKNQMHQQLVFFDALNIENDPVNMVIKQDPKAYWHVISNYECRLGLNYSPSRLWKSLYMNIEAGYELIQFWKFLKQMYFVGGENTAFSINEWSDFGLQGPYVKLTLRY